MTGYKLSVAAIEERMVKEIPPRRMAELLIDLDRMTAALEADTEQVQVTRSATEYARLAMQGDSFCGLAAVPYSSSLLVGGVCRALRAPLRR